MKIEIDLPDQIPNKGLKLEWEDNFMIATRLENRGVVIVANKDGLVSLARHLLTMAMANLPLGYHIHFDDSNSLEPGSCELIIEKR